MKFKTDTNHYLTITDKKIIKSLLTDDFINGTNSHTWGRTARIVGTLEKTPNGIVYYTQTALKYKIPVIIL